MRWFKVLGGLLGAALLGALGSGLWDLFLKRFVLWCWDGSTTLASLGVAALRNTPYTDAARGSPHDTLLAFLFFIGCGFFGWFMRAVDPTPTAVAPASATPEQKAAALSRRVWIARGLLFGLFFLAALQLGQVRLTYRLVDDFSHNIAALTPLVEPKEAAAYRFAFTHMKSSEDFKALMGRMHERAKAAGVELPR